MVLFNHTTRELTAKIVYYGPGLSGKTTNLRALHERLDQGSTGRLLSLATAQDRTIYFDLLPVELGNIKGYAVRFQLCTVPGQVFYNETRKLVLKGVDGIVFVVDSQWSMLSHNLESFQNLRDNLREAGVAPESVPTVVQFNKRDLPGVLSIEALQESLGFRELPFVEAVAPDGRGVVETFKLASKLTFIDLMRRLQRPSSLALRRTDELGKRAGLPDAGASAVVEPSPPDARPALARPASPSDSPFEIETSEDLPSPSTDEIFGIPLRLPDAPAPEELIGFGPPRDPGPPPLPVPPNSGAPRHEEVRVPVELIEPEPPPTVAELRPQEPGEPAPREFTFDLSAEPADDAEAGGPAAGPATDAAPEAEPEAAPEPALVAAPASTPELVPESGPEPAPGPDLEASPGEATEPGDASLAGTTAEGDEAPAEPAQPPVAALSAPVAEPPPAPRTAAEYEMLERRVSDLEGRLDRVLAALRGALGEPAGDRGPRRDPSPEDAEDPGI